MAENRIAPKKKSFMGVLALVCAVVGAWLLFLGFCKGISDGNSMIWLGYILLILAVIFGFIYRAQVTSGGMVGVGVAQTVIFFIMLCAVLFTITPLVFQSAYKSPQSSCQNNLKQLSLGMRMYFMDYNAYPPQNNWNQAIYPYVKLKGVYICPKAEDQTMPSYAINSSVKRLKSGDSGADTIMFFDSISGKNLAGGGELLPNPSRHSEGANFSFMDGRVKWMTPEKTVGMWVPVGNK